MSSSPSTHNKEMPALRELQAKYDAVLAENDQLYHGLRVEQAQHERYRSAYRRVQEDVQKDQEVLRQLYTQLRPDTEDQEEASADESEGKAGVKLAGPSAATATGSGAGGDRVRALERDCDYLRGKVETLHSALQRYEHGEIPAQPTLSVAPQPSHAPHSALRTEKSDAAAAANVAALHAERERRRRAEEQLTRCHATLRSLRDDAAQKEFFFHQQLAAVQEQNAALLQDLDTWVTGEQQTLLTSTFASRIGGAAKLNGAPPPPSSPPASVAPATPSSVDEAVPAKDALKVRQMQQYLQDQEEVLALKERSIEQLEARVRELEKQVADAAVRQREPVLPSSSVAVPLKDLQHLRREAAAVEACTKRFASSHLPRAQTEALSPFHTPHQINTAQEVSAGAVLEDIRGVLHYVMEVLTLGEHATATAVQPQRSTDTGLRAPPLTVVQPTQVSSPYCSGETLSEAAQQLAKLMRRHVQH